MYQNLVSFHSQTWKQNNCHMCEKNKKANIIKIIKSVLGIDPKTLGELKLFDYFRQRARRFQN